MMTDWTLLLVNSLQSLCAAQPVCCLSNKRYWTDTCRRNHVKFMMVGREQCAAHTVGQSQGTIIRQRDAPMHCFEPAHLLPESKLEIIALNNAYGPKIIYHSLGMSFPGVAPRVIIDFT